MEYHSGYFVLVRLYSIYPHKLNYSFVVRVANIWIANYGKIDNSSLITTHSAPNLGFYPRDAMLARVIEIATCLSVRPSVRHAPVLCQNEES